MGQSSDRMSGIADLDRAPIKSPAAPMNCRSPTIGNLLPALSVPWKSVARLIHEARHVRVQADTRRRGKFHSKMPPVNSQAARRGFRGSDLTHRDPLLQTVLA